MAPAVALLLVGCTEPPSPERTPETEPAPEPPALVPPETRAETFEQFSQFRALSQRIAELETEIAAGVLSWESYRFEEFLELDPWALGTDQVYFLKHFCEGGQILLKEQTAVLLLEREIDRRRREALGYGEETASGKTARHRLNARFASAIGRLEQRILDLEKVAAMTSAVTDSEIAVPGDVGADQLEAARRYVADRQETLRSEKAKLTGRTAELEAFLAKLEKEAGGTGL